MERSNGNSWIKHLDFLIFDVICMEVSLVLAYLLRNSLGAGVVLGRLYAVMAGVLLLVNLVVALFNESYRSILRRGYLKEFKAAFIHTSLVVLLSLLALYLMKSVDHYSRMIFLTMWCLYLLLTYLVRCLWKNHLMAGESQWRKAKPPGGGQRIPGGGHTGKHPEEQLRAPEGAGGVAFGWRGGVCQRGGHGRRQRRSREEKFCQRREQGRWKRSNRAGRHS